MKTQVHPPGFEQIKQEEQARLFGRVARLRLWVVPLIVGLLLWMLFYPVTPWRQTVLFALGFMASLFFWREAFVHRRKGFRRSALPRNLGGAAIGHSIACFATGGLGSPFLFALFPILMVGALVLGPFGIFFMAGIQVIGIWTMFAIEVFQVIPNWNLSIFGGGISSGWNAAHLLWNAIFLSVGVFVTLFLGHAVRSAFETMITRGLFMQSELLESHAERAHEMALLSGEIAHELKNPLASIKGLAGLLQQTIDDMKGAERVSVLRREVDRMQSILEEFLNFSRPLLPLAKVPLPLNDLLDEVMALYEGLAHEKGITFVRQGLGQTRLCDPRKIKQVLINLLQNALEASPRGTVIELASLPDGVLEIRDQGTGVPAMLEGKIYEPGVTSKPNGSGLGLTIARAIMRQHGGEMTLRPREGGGTVVTLCLPDENGAACVPAS